MTHAHRNSQSEWNGTGTGLHQKILEMKGKVDTRPIPNSEATSSANYLQMPFISPKGLSQEK